MKMGIYRHFAQVYDMFMADVPYKQWAGYVDAAFRDYNVPTDGLVLDLACGTGTMAFLMAQKGYELIGVDASEDMLSEAQSKIHEKMPTKGILFLNQDMRELELYGTVDAAYCVCDSLNYILKEEELELVFRNVSLYLNPDGIFLFDMKTVSKYQQMGNNTYHDIMDESSYLWKNLYDTETSLNEYHVQFFVKGEETFSETHYQRGYSIEAVTEIVERSGLKILAVYDNYTNNPAGPDNERYTFICRNTAPM